MLFIGLDGAAPQWVFDRWLDVLPRLRSFLERRTFGVLRSCDPSITVPAWSSMTSSRSPGALGFYGFRNRRGGALGPGPQRDLRNVAPTILQLLGEAIPADMEGVSMLASAS